MSPGSSVYYVGDSRYGYEVLRSDSSQRSCAQSNLKDLSSGQFCHVVLLPALISVSAFLRAVRVVLCEGTYTKMLRINARRVITLMNDTQSWRNWAVRKFCGKPMDEQFLFPVAQRAISGLVSVTSPNPAASFVRSLSNFISGDKGGVFTFCRAKSISRTRWGVVGMASLARSFGVFFKFLHRLTVPHLNKFVNTLVVNF